MDTINVSYYLQKTTKKKTEFPLIISVTWNNQRLRTTLGMSVAENLWDKKKQRLKGSAANPIQFNMKLDLIRTKLNEYNAQMSEAKRIPRKKDILECIHAVVQGREAKLNTKVRKKKQAMNFIELFDE